MGAIITIVLNLLLIPKIGYFGSAWATLICYFTMALTSYVFSRKYYYIPYEKTKIISYLMISVFLYMVPGVFEIKGLLYNLILIVLYLCIVIFFENVNRKTNELR